MGSYQKQGKGYTEDWITPPDIIRDLGPFDLDPCVCRPQPFVTAAQGFDKLQDGLAMPWHGFVWMNPPYGQPAIRQWMQKLAEHNHGIALIFARTETVHWTKSIWYNASALYFFHGRINFFTPQGTEANDGGAPSVLVGYGDEALRRLSAYKGRPGRFIPIPSIPQENPR